MAIHIDVPVLKSGVVSFKPQNLGTDGYAGELLILLPLDFPLD